MVLKVWDETGAVTKEKTLRASLFISLKWESLSNSQLLMVSRVLKHMGRGYLFIFFPPFFCHFPLDAGISPSVSVTAADGSTILWRTQTNTNTETLAQSTSTPDRDAASEKKKQKKTVWMCQYVHMLAACVCVSLSQTSFNMHLCTRSVTKYKNNADTFVTIPHYSFPAVLSCMYYGAQLPVIYLTEAATARANVMLPVTSFFFELFGGN